MFKPFCFLPLLFCTVFSNAQSWQWADRWTSTPNITLGEITLIKTDPEGNVYSGGEVHNDGTTSMTGLITHFGILSLVDSSNVGQGFVVKTNSAGEWYWVLGTQHANGGLADIAPDSFGNLYVLGAYDSSYCTFGNYPMSHGALPTNVYGVSFLAKVDPSGNVIWAKNLAVGALGSLLRLDGAGNLYIAGYYLTNTITIGTVLHKTDSLLRYPDAFIARFDTAGNAIWGYSMGTDGTTEPSCMAVTRDGKIYLGGTYQYSDQLIIGVDTLTNSSNYGNFVARFDQLGHPIWANAPDTLVNFTDFAVDSVDNLYTTGGFTSASVSFGACSLTTGGPAHNNLMLVKYDSSGACLWADAGKGDSSATGYSLSIDNCGNIWVTGGFESYIPVTTMYFNGDTVSIPPAYTYDPDLLFIAQYNTSGTFAGCNFISGGGDDYCAITVDNYGNFLLGGDWIRGPYIFGSDTLNNSTGSEYFFMAKYFYDTGHCLPTAPPPMPLSAQPMIYSDNIMIYPNPAANSCILHLDTYPAAGKVDLCDLNGRLISAWPITGQDTELPLNDVAPGVYLCRIYTDSDIQVRKLVVLR